MGRRALVVAVVLLAVVSARAAAQTELDASRIFLGAAPCAISAGSGSPEGAVTGSVCDQYIDLSTSDWYQKSSGAGNTGWSKLARLNAAANAFTGNMTVGGTFGVTGVSTLGGNILTFDAAAMRLRATGQTRYRAEWYPSGASGAYLTSYDSNGAGVYLPLTALASQVTLRAPTTIWGDTIIRTGGLNVGGDGADPGDNNLWVNGHVQGTKRAYVSQTTGWRISEDGEGDFRYLYADELHAKTFVADLEQALAGGQIISKSVAKLAATFVAPSAGDATTLTVFDLPSADGMAVFESGDTVRIRQFSRAAGSLSITDCWGVVTNYADGAGGTQTWTFTRSATMPGAMTPTTAVAAESIVLDYGVSGNGYYEVSAVDGAYSLNSPYMQIVSWSGTPSGTGPTLTLRTRCGNLRGITGVTGEYGCILGTYGTSSSGQYVRASNQAVELHGVPFSMYSGATEVIKMTTTPYFAMGNPAPSSFSSGAGCWSGLDAGIYKWRCGNPAGQYINWDGTNLNINGTVTVTWAGISDKPAAVTTLNPPSGSGLFLSSTYMGYYAAGAFATYIDSSGNFRLGDPTGTAGISWTQGTSTLAIKGSITVTGGNALVTGGAAADVNAGATTISGGKITTGTITANEIAALTITAGKLNIATLAAISADLGAVTAGSIVVGTTNKIWLNEGADGILAIGGTTKASAPFRVTAAGALTATSATITGAITATSGDVTSAITAGSITSAMIAANTIVAADIAAGTITATEIAASTITGAKIAASTITASNLSVSTLSAISADLGTVTAGTVDGATIRAGSGDEVVLDSGGISLTGGVTSRSKVHWNDGSYVGVTSANTLDVYGPVNVVLTGGTTSVYVGFGALYGATGVDLGSSGSGWDELYISPTTTTGSYYPLVLNGDQVLSKTNGASGTGCGSVDVESGIVTNCGAPPLPNELIALRREVDALRAEVALLAAQVGVSR